MSESVLVMRQVHMLLDPNNAQDRVILDYIDNDLPYGKREVAVKQALLTYIKSRTRNRQQAK